MISSAIILKSNLYPIWLFMIRKKNKAGIHRKIEYRRSERGRITVKKLRNHVRHSDQMTTGHTQSPDYCRVE